MSRHKKTRALAACHRYQLRLAVENPVRRRSRGNGRRGDAVRPGAQARCRSPSAGRPVMSRLDDLLRCRPRPLGPCEASLGAGRAGGEDRVAEVCGELVCTWHRESAAEVAALALRLTGGWS